MRQECKDKKKLDFDRLRASTYKQAERLINKLRLMRESVMFPNVQMSINLFED